MSKKSELVAAGLDPHALRFATAMTENGEYHVVLTVEDGKDLHRY
ncbi:MAG: hypothetical protein R3C97_06305 [Geminicoccaceae bacterium]